MWRAVGFSPTFAHRAHLQVYANSTFDPFNWAVAGLAGKFATCLNTNYNHVYDDVLARTIINSLGGFD